MRHRLTSLLLVALALVIATPDPALAYIDPGSGALVVQALVASLIGGLFLVKRSVRNGWNRLRLRLRLAPARPASEDSGSEG